MIESDSIFKEKETLIQQDKIREKETLSMVLSVDEIAFQGLKLKGRKNEMMQTMGKPDSIIEPKYDCGPFQKIGKKLNFTNTFIKR